MTKLKIINFGIIKSESIRDLIEYYKKLTGKYYSIEFLTYKDVRERKIEMQDFNYKGFLIALSEKGRDFDTVQFKDFLSKKIMTEEQITFVIGNAYGIHENVLAKADLILSISKMTTTHEFSLIFLLEQLYRIFNLEAGGKYHK